MTKEEFVLMLTDLHFQSECGELAGYKTLEEAKADWYDDVGNEYDCALLVKAFGRLCVDDPDESPVREGGQTSTKLYPLEEIDKWPEGLFEKLSNLVWWLPPEDRKNPLDMMVEATKPRPKIQGGMAPPRPGLSTDLPSWFGNSPTDDPGYWV